MDDQTKVPKRISRLWLLGLSPLVFGLLLSFLTLRSAAMSRVQPVPLARSAYERLWRLVIGAIALITALVLLSSFLSRIGDVLILVSFAVIVATAIRPLATTMSRWRVPRFGFHLPITIAVLLIYLGLLVVIALIGFIIVPRLYAEIQDLVSSLPQYAAYLAGLTDRLADYPVIPSPREVRGTLSDQMSSILSYAVDVLAFTIALIGGILSFLLVAVVALFLVRDASRIIDHFVTLLPVDTHQKARDVVGKAGEKIQGWVAGTLLLAIIVGSMTTLGLLILGIPYPFLLGLIMALAELVPMIGPYIGAAPALLIALTQSLQTLFFVAILYVLIQQIENNLLGPLIMGKNVELPPLLVVIALVTGASLLGVVGALLAIPFAAVAQVVWLDVVVPWIKGIERYWRVN